MATSIASQLQAIRSIVKADTDPLKRPFTRPSILFDAKEAADIDLDTIFSLALSGLEVLVSLDERFGNYKNDLFTHKSRELDRELLGIEDNNHINASISSYLRLLSGHFMLPSALRTLEYLIRRYKIHMYNTEELILCALPYHDTHVFVRMVQLLDTGHGKWKFLEGVKISGAPPPRKVIVQQSVHDMGVLEALCNYASPTKKLQPTRPVISFCTAVVIEVLGSLAVIDTDVVKRILPYVVSGLQTRSKGNIDHKAGSLMIVGLLANRSALSPDLVKSLIRSIADVAREDAEQSTDLQMFRVSIMALVNVVQLQSVAVLPKKVVDILKDISDLSGILSGLTKEFNIDKFLAVFLESLMEHSADDDQCHQVLLSMIKTIPINALVGRLVSRLLSTCMKSSKKGSKTSSSAPGSKVKEILVSINEHYMLELREAVQSFLEDLEGQPKKDSSAYEVLCKTLDGGLDSSFALSDSKIWFGLEHPQARVRRATVVSLGADPVLRDKAVNSQKIQTVHDALLRRLYDDDLSVVQAVLSMGRLSEFLQSKDLFDGLQIVFKRCISILISKASDNTTLATDVTVSCLEHVTSSFLGEEGYANDLAAMIFPLVLFMPKTQSVNLKALDAAKELNWPLYQRLVTISTPGKKLALKSTSAVNMDNINVMAESFLANSDEYMQWFVGCCQDLELSKTLFFLILLHSLTQPQKDFGQFSALYESCFPVIIEAWEKLQTTGFGVATEESNRRMLDRDCKAFLDQMYDVKLEELNAEILICIFWRLLEAFIATAFEDVSKDENNKREAILQNLFIFFSSHSKAVFKKHLHHLVANHKVSPARFLSSFFTDEGVAVSVQTESLRSFAFLCFQLEEGIRFKNEIDEGLLLQLPAEFPSVLVPMSSDDQGIRAAAMSCIEGLFSLWPHVSLSGGKNGRSAAWSHFLGDLLALIVQQKKLILSDTDFLSDFFTTLLSSSHHSLLVPQSVGERFDRPTKDGVLKFVLGSALTLSPYGMLKVLSLLKGLGSQVMVVKEVNSVLTELLERRSYIHSGYDTSRQALSKIEVKILCLLLECCTKSTSAAGGHAVELYILKALQVDRSYSEDPSVIQPCVTVLRCLNGSLYGGFKREIQELLFQELVYLFRSYNGDIQNAARVALLQINVSTSTIQRMLDFVLEKAAPSHGSPHGKKKKKAMTHLKSESNNDAGQRRCSKLSFLSSLLDILLLKKDVVNRIALVEPLFKHLSIVFMDKEWICEAVKQDEEHAEASSDISQSTASAICYVQQNLLSVLEDISNSLVAIDSIQDGIVQSFDIKLLVSCARSTEDSATRNHVFSLLSAVAKVIPDRILDYILDILTVIGESAVTQWDGHSKKVFEDLISTIVPCWLSKTENPDKLLQIFLNVLPNVAEHRRLSIVVHLLRVLGESGSLASLLVLLFRSLASKQNLFGRDINNTLGHLSTTVCMQWEYAFALQISEQYSCMVWLPSLVTLLQKIEMGAWDQKLFVQLLVAMQFISDKLQDPEIAFKLKSGEDVNSIQATSGALMENVVTHLQLIGSRTKQHGVPTSVGKELKELMHVVLTSVRKGLLPSTYFKVMIILLGHTDRNVRKKALGLLCEMAKECSTLTQKHHRKVLNPSVRSSWLCFDELTLQCFEKMCHEILKIVDDRANSLNYGSLRLAAVSTLEVLVTVFSSSDSIFNVCLATVIKHIHSDDLAFSSGCFRTVGALINVLGPRALSELPSIMDHVFRRCHSVSSCKKPEIKDTDDISSSISSNSEEPLFMSILVTIEAVIDKLGGFLNPYLGQILELLILRPQYANNSSSKLTLKADAVQKLITGKIPVRLSLPPLLKIYSEAIKCGNSALSITFQMLGNFISTMDRLSISAYYLNIFDLCLLALDLRRQHPASVENIAAVEKDVINAMVALTMKLTENMFKPLFIRCVEWSEYAEQTEDSGHANIDRAISFFGLIQKLVDSHRSLFVPYFKYFLNGLVRHLSDDVARPGPTRKKKAKLVDPNINKGQENSSLSVGKWHLRALVLSSLHRCFLYDTGNLEFLDSSNFQELLKPIISQLVVDPPSSLEQHPDVPSVNEVDDVLVSCVGQMAVTSASDLLWKPLNHEVLMQTRSEKVRSRILGLKIVKYMVENLREEYLVLLPETIPFLGELLEDVEPSVKSLAQEILKEMETMSGESLRQYL
ncbi:uncharacterized protein At3g06530 isoform X2 [Cynara cardunculus var. scolymus]|uniref:uncharacterized protein At3g06530 isoform X2 n=1 Tax=Cynara cardunculus var. scolymus TaxID=59895 RepID=UPI000D6288E7|nr:uncharacterized protein At3g06530 isoform X2 [Cynara cardunculus var. scolymus]